MRIAVLSDIHGNYVALQACIDYALDREIDTFVFLGDYVGELAYPQKTMDILFSLREKYHCFFIKGNKEKYWTYYEENGEKEWQEFNSTTGSLYYTYYNLSQKDLEFFRFLQITDELIFEGFAPITICHGSPQKVNEKLLPEDERTFSIMESNKASYILCGHIHVQGKIEHNGKMVLNPGAVGVSLHSEGKAQFMILDGAQNTWNYEFVSLEYDVDKVIEDLHASGLSERAPAWCRVTEHLLRTGELAHGTALEKAMEWCVKMYGECSWPNVPEECWEPALKELLGEESMKSNNKPIVAIRADGNETLGMGHLMRCMSIAKALEKQGAQCVFFVAKELAGAFIREKGFACEVLDTDYQDMEAELPRLREALEHYAPKLWLVDSYQITQNYLKELQKMCPVFYLDDTGAQTYAADGLINYNIYGDALGYETKCPREMKLLLGAKYAPVKEEFVQTSYAVREDVQNVLITMGGSDKLNITGVLSQSLLQRLPEDIELTLICGRFNSHLQELLKLQESNPRVHVLVDVTDMWNKLAQADIAVSAAGSTMYELSAMGVPTVCCYYVENQRQIAEGFATKVGMCNAGDFSVEQSAVLERLTEAVCELVADKASRKSLSERMKQVADGQGAVRIARALKEAGE